MAKKAPVSEVRAWAKQQGFDLGDRGRLPSEVWEAWEQRTAKGSLPQPRPAVDEPPVATADELAEAHSRIATLEQQLAALTDRLTALENRPEPEPRRLFARAR